MMSCSKWCQYFEFRISVINNELHEFALILRLFLMTLEVMRNKIKYQKSTPIKRDASKCKNVEAVLHTADYLMDSSASVGMTNGE